jgi:hypothetical protein
VILLAVVELLIAEPLQQINALKNVLQAADNAAPRRSSSSRSPTSTGSSWPCSRAARSRAASSAQGLARAFHLLRAALVVMASPGFSIPADGSQLSIQKIEQARARVERSDRHRLISASAGRPRRP